MLNEIPKIKVLGVGPILCRSGLSRIKYFLSDFSLAAFPESGVGGGLLEPPTGY